MYDKMGNFFYRPCPIRIYNSEQGSSTFYSYGANQITGWRRKQEDRYVCLPKFHEDLSLFAVYDGHGGERVVQYLERYLHQYIRTELKLFKDPEMALYLGFMNCDRSMRSITCEELDVIKEDLNKEFELNESHDRRKVIREFASRDPTDSAKANKNEPNPDEGSSTSNPDEDSSTSKPADSSSKPNTGSIFNQMPDAMKEEIMDKVIEELPHVANSIFYLTKAPLAKENDDSDETFEPDDDGMKAKIFDESSDNESEESTGNESDECAANENEESVENEQAEQTGNDEEMNQNEKSSETGNKSDCHEMDISDEPLDNKESTAEHNDRSQNAANNEPDFNEKRVKVKSAKRKLKPKIGQTCGSTATVLLLNEEKLHIANVGDSRCVACINGQAVDLSVDHRPTDEEERIRIMDCGGKVSEDGRVNDTLDMSRAFGDFEMKLEDIDAPFNLISSEPHITTIDVTSDLEFIVVASDGIWNTMDSCDVIEYIRERMKDSQMELRDIIAELFEEMLPSQLTADGSGCDNMTAIIIKIDNDCCSNKDIIFLDTYVYKYPPELLETNTDLPGTQQGTLQIEEDSSQMVKPSDLCQPHEEEYSRNEDDNMDEILEPIPTSFNDASNSGCNDNFQNSNIRQHQKVVKFLSQLYFTIDSVNAKMEDIRNDIAVVNNKCNYLSEITTNIKAVFDTELPQCNDLNYFSDENAFSSAISRLETLNGQNSYNTQNAGPSTSFSSTPIYISEDAPDTHASTSRIYPNTTASLATHPSTSHIHQPFINPDTPESPGKPISPDQIPRVSLSRREKRLLYASNPQDTHEVIDLTEVERDSSATNRVASEPEHDHVQVAKREAEESDEVSKKLKTDDYAISNTEKHK